MMGHESPATVGNTGLGHRRSVLKWLTALPFVGVMIPQAQARPPLAPTVVLNDGCLRQVAMYHAKAQLYAGLLSDKMEHPHWPALDMFVTDWGIDLLVMGYDAYPESWRACTHHELFSFDEIEDGHTYKDEFYARLRKIMERYT
jgi:hypothetical protein